MKKKIISVISSFCLIFTLTGLTNHSFASERIVVSGGSLTEIVFALGAGEQVVGVDLTSSYPESVKQLPQIGYWKLLNIEGILSLNPSLFITWRDAEPENIIPQVEQAKVDVLALQRVPGTIELLYENIEKIAEKLQKKPEADQLISEIRQNITQIQQQIATHPNKTKAIFILSMGSSNMVAGKNTIADAIMTIAGGENIATHKSYKTYSAESLIAMDPEVIVLTTQSIEQLGGMDKLDTIPGLTKTSAWKNNRIIAIDQAYLLGLGPRVGQAVDILYHGFYPQ